MLKFNLILIVTLINSFFKCNCHNYTPDWQSLDSRPLPKWYDQAKVGIFIHWGVYSVPSYTSEWFWNELESSIPNICQHFLKENYSPKFNYQDFADSFKAELFDPSQWAELFARSGAKYVVLTSKHHEGFTLWSSNTSWNWNSLDRGPKCDLIQKLATEIRNQNLHFGLYHSLLEWFNPLYLQDKSNNFTTNYFVKGKTLLELYDLVNRYEPEIIWSDGEWEAPDDYWQSKEFLAWLYNNSTVKDTVVVNDRWGKDTLCRHGGYYTCQDRFNPNKIQERKFENAMTLDKNSWGFSRLSNLDDYLTTKELISILIETVSFGGNILINIGPRADGTIDIIFQERLKDLGNWLNINGQAIYNSKLFKKQQDELTMNFWYTQDQNDQIFYGLFTFWPEYHKLYLNLTNFINNSTRISLLTNLKEIDLKFTLNPIGVIIYLKPECLLHTKWAWTIKFDKSKSDAINAIEEDF